MNIVALVGASCTGKTTLFEQLKDKYMDNSRVLFVEEAARIFFAKNDHLGLEQRFSKDTQRSIQSLAIELISEATEKNPELIICDRTVMDPIVYTRVNTGDSGEDLFDNVKDFVPRYDKIFLLSPEGIPFVNDNERHEGADMRDRLHKGFVEFFSEHQIPFTLITGDSSERMRSVESEIEQEIT